MLIIHATQKLLNTSRLKASMYISEPSEGQMLHSWYCRLLATGFQGKLFVMYVQEPSLLTVICRGKTIKGTFEEFKSRLPSLLEKFKFESSFIKKECKYLDDYVVAKTNNKSILAHMNQMVIQLEYDCSRFNSYDNISQDILEERMMIISFNPVIKATPIQRQLIFGKNEALLDEHKFPVKKFINSNQKGPSNPRT